MNTAEFVRTVLLEEVQAMHHAGVYFHTLSAIAHGIEVCGALMDKRPFKAKGLGRSRFSAALRQLFPDSYTVADHQLDLYGQLRSHMSHSMIPGNLVNIQKQGHHLLFDKGVLHVSMEQLFSDYVLAIQRLLKMAESDALPHKRIITFHSA